MSKRLALVTGASSGIGAATARQLGALGWKVVVLARRAERLKELAQDIREAGGEAVVEAVDGGDGTAVLAMADRVLHDHGVPEFIVHCAGAGQWKYCEDTPPDEIASMMSAPFFAAFHVDHAFLKPMMERGSGVLVHVNSPASAMSWPGSTGYACSRWALRGLQECLRQDLAGTGVHSCHAVFGEVTSEYFEANAGSRDRLPWLAAYTIPVSSPEQCAAKIVPLADAPRDIIYPLMLRLFYAMNAVMPGVVRLLTRHTGHQR